MEVSTTQKTSSKKVSKKEKLQKSEAQIETGTVQEPQPEKSTSELEEVKAEGTPQPEPAKTMSLTNVQKVVESLAKTIVEHSQQITELQEMLVRKRKAVSNGKVQIRDKQTGKVYPSKNNCYKSLLKAGELKELVAQGIFGAVPEKNTFGWYALVRALPDRFEEVKPEQAQTDGKS